MEIKRAHVAVDSPPGGGRKRLSQRGEGLSEYVTDALTPA